MPQFLIMAEDCTDTGAPDRRLAARPVHLQRMQEEKAKGIFIIGGAKLDEEGNMYGSMLMVNLPDINAVNSWIACDPYVTGRVWNTIAVTPFRIAEV